MKLYEAKRNSKVKLMEDVSVPPGAPPLKKGDVINFHHIDGMYSYATHPDYNIPVHVAAWTEVEYA